MPLRETAADIGWKRKKDLPMVHQKRILVVEDNELNRGMLCEILAEEYGVLEVSNGQEALDILNQSRDSISLILLDVMMPVMDGYTFLNRLREDPELSLIPVIVMTQGSSEEDEVAALANGATDFVPKPYRPQVILHRIASLIKLRETAAMVNQFQFDRLTGLYSKEFFYRKVRERLDSELNRSYSIVCTNIENFKLYNDSFGREAGDRLLKEGAELLREITGEEGICGRYGADRFLCFMDQEREKQQRELYAQYAQYRSASTMGTTSIRWGIYEITDRSVSVEQMCDRAQLALDSAEGKYRGLPYTIYDDALRGKLLREKAIADAMEQALTQEQFVVYLQPKYSLKGSYMAGAEALVRWIHPEWGFISPGEFIPLFEKNGFIYRLDQYVWEHVCAMLRQWQDKGMPLLPVSVNVSRADIYRLDLVETLRRLVQEYGVDPAYLHLEITESAYAENTGQIVSTVSQLRQLGFPIEMDDFGSGYSSLNILGQMKLDILKLDMKFVRNEITKPADQSILGDVIAMAHRMKLQVVAEGVETREQIERLMTVGCDFVQGYYFAAPMPVEKFEPLWLSQRKPAAEFRAKPVEPDSRVLLVVDESPAYRKRVRDAFGGAYSVLTASDTETALTCLRERRDIAVIILSMTLPGADRLMKDLRQDMSLWRIPVLASIPSGKAVELLPAVMETDDFLCKCHPMFDLRRRVDRLMEAVRSREREQELQDEANRDFLTGLLNRRGLQMAVDSLSEPDLPLAVFLIDLDNLKQTNDTCGHEVGDRLIQNFAALLRRQTRSGDILCRYGGDEFVVILRRMGQRQDALNKGRRICENLRGCLENVSVEPSCSVGIALCGAGERPCMDLIDRADRAMYQAKRGNKGGCCLWDDAMQAGVEE